MSDSIFSDYSVNVLLHSGVKGMRWGIRRYQNKDGSLTEAGKKRYRKLSSENEEYEKKIAKYSKKVERDKTKMPSFYLTDIGKWRQEKAIRKLAVDESKIAKYEKKIESNKKMQAILTKASDAIDNRDISIGKAYSQELIDLMNNPQYYNSENGGFTNDGISALSTLNKKHQKG